MMLRQGRNITFKNKSWKNSYIFIVLVRGHGGNYKKIQGTFSQKLYELWLRSTLLLYLTCHVTY